MHRDEMSTHIYAVTELTVGLDSNDYILVKAEEKADCDNCIGDDH
jgi:hypothetical protein